jgi:hypothetical protein
MTKTLSYRLFGAGKIPEALAAQLKGEGILFLDEGVKGSVTYLDFRAPGRYANWRRQWGTASLALTELRLLALQNSQTSINVPLTDERIHKMQFSLEESDTLLIAFDPSLFHHDWSGQLEYRFRTLQAQDLLDKLRKLTA